MRKFHSSVWLIPFSVFIVFIWMIPILLAGYPFWISACIKNARDFTDTGLVTGISSSMSTIILWLFHPVIDWSNIMGWTLLSAGFMMTALVVWWWCIFKIFGARVAWISTIIFALMPMYWVEAVRLGGYSFAFVFLFLSFLSFILLFPRNKIFSSVISGIFFGATIASNHAFLTFIIWIVIAYLWMQRKRWKVALLELVLFLGFAYAAYASPLIPNALQTDMTPLDRVAIFLPSTKEHMTGNTHLYPDSYAYEFLRDDFDEVIKDQVADLSFLEKQQGQNFRIMFGVEEAGIIKKVLNGFWLLVNVLPPLVLSETVGGIFLWLFILPGIFFLYRENKKLLILIFGLWVAMEFQLRFILHYGRDHLMDVGWALSIFAALGIVSISKALKPKKLSLNVICILMLIVISIQLVQANRKIFALLYYKSEVPLTFAMKDVLDELPENAFVAHPRKENMFLFSDTDRVVLHNPTIDFLAERGRLKEPFDYYGVTHIFGYNKTRSDQILKAVKGVELIEEPEIEGVPLTPLVRLILHVVR
ncbi:MAG: hypothetical protein K9M03_00145 [Kiritimatiellales bacterium]|nr:hypothetical protein [Kiritimatiellales bacterium]